MFLAARRRLPDQEVLLGCARPPGMHERVTDAYAVMARLDGIAFSADDVLAVAASIRRPAHPEHACCSIKIGARVKANGVAPQGGYLPNHNILTPQMRSPEYVQLSTAAAMTLGLMLGRMHRCACTRCLNLLSAYPEGCRANCAYSGLARHREAERDFADRKFIRIDWPAVPMEQVVDIVARDGEATPFHRMCILMITHPRTDRDTVDVLKAWTARVPPERVAISILSNPTTMSRDDVVELHGLGAHTISGMGETEHEALALVQRLVELGGHSHMFCFFPEKTSLMDHLPATPRDQSRRMQLARYLIDNCGVWVAQMGFDENGRGADLVVLCTPVGTYAEIAEALADHLKPGAILTDVGSVKQAVIRDVGPYVPEGVHFVPGHPVAGTERSGPQAGFAELFEGRWCILTPPPGTDQAAVARLSELWRRCGSMVEIMDARHHDEVLAITSHLPHLIAYTIVGTASDVEQGTLAEVAKFAAGGFRDFTRIAGSNPIMWRDIFLNNRDAVLEMLQRFTEDLTALQRAIRWGEGETLETLFRRTREVRQSVIEAHQAGTFDAREPEQAGITPPDPDKTDRPGE